jgi:ribosome maturation protein Sdo1
MQIVLNFLPFYANIINRICKPFQFAQINQNALFVKPDRKIQLTNQIKVTQCQSTNTEHVSMISRNFIDPFTFT